MIPQIHEFPAVAIPPKPRIDIETLVNTKLPPSPGSLVRINNLLRDYNSSSRQISEAISYEPAVVARILRLANSPIYALERNITSVKNAVTAVGTKILQEIVMVEFASATFGKQIKNSYFGEKIWQHSLAVAFIARELSRTLEMHGSDEAFTCGLLHDLGKLILLSNDYEAYSEILSNELAENEMLTAENRQYGYNHAEIGSLVARRWGLPDGVYYTILHHHNPSQANQPMFIAHIVDVADIIANIQGYGNRPEEPESLLLSESVMKLGFTPETLDKVWERVEGRYP